MKPYILTLLILLHISTSYATTWAAALPYTQTTEGQQVIIKAKAYEPYKPYPYGETEVYYKNKLLYTIDKYFRTPIYTSNNGEYLIIPYTNNYSGVTSTIYFGQNWIKYDDPAIVVYKNGQLFKTYTLRDVIDTSTLVNNGVLYDWGYSMYWPRETELDIQFGCDACVETYGQNVLESCDTSEIDADECIECRHKCDSLKLYKQEQEIAKKSIFVKGNKLYILTNQDNIIVLNLNDNTALSKMPFSSVVKDKNTYNPPKTIVEYSKLELPDKFATPKLVSGESIDSALAKYLNTTLCTGDKDENYWCISLYKLVINSRGLCDELDIFVSFYGNKKSNLSRYSTKQLKEKIEQWLMLQHYHTDILPKGFKKYSFYDFMYFY